MALLRPCGALFMLFEMRWGPWCWVQAPSRVIRLRPLYGFANRVGRPVFIRFPRTIGAPQVKRAGAHAYQASLLLPAGSRSNVVQVGAVGPVPAPRHAPGWGGAVWRFTH